MSEELFDSFVQQINQFRKWLAQNKLTPVTDRVMLHARLKNGHRVAGETDLLAIEQHGNLVIFDFKTSKFDFDESYKTARGDQKWSTERQHSRQLTGYENLINSEFEQRYPVTRRIIVPFRIGYTTQDGMFDTFTSIES
jgi:ATP-dependent exoDNAse (exonuclease V) beta subunit